MPLAQLAAVDGKNQRRSALAFWAPGRKQQYVLGPADDVIEGGQRRVLRRSPSRGEARPASSGNFNLRDHPPPTR
ncbi:hypothetical protein PCASD_16091 [Puccinia coronata f. sp. avenae]|uniref:Uncharacterized protein n=1 Tax=Puccinia coronata f. sp. avenae TaxID=200324 RepID=A0A2N5TXW1_9BASI|nr:hypothetical protein PCASD_16091 [Puccinia coronata f. sp. avenae]